MLTPLRFAISRVRVSVAATIYGGRLRDQPELAARLLDGHSPFASRRGYLLQLAAAAGWTSLPFLQLIRQRTLLLAGDDDPIVPMANARLIESPAANAERHLYHDGRLGLHRQRRRHRPGDREVSSTAGARCRCLEPRSLARRLTAVSGNGRSRSPPSVTKGPGPAFPGTSGP